MIKKIFKLFFTTLILFFSIIQANAVEFKIVVLPTDIFNVCENYFCFPETSEIAADNIILQINSYKNISAYPLDEVRGVFANNPELKFQTQTMLDNFKNNESIDFDILKQISENFDVKSILLVSSYVTNNETNKKRNLWEILEITSAFNIAHPFYLKTNAVLTDTVNNTVMWSGKHTKNISDTNEYFTAKNLSQAASQLEKIKMYYRNYVSENISQNIKLRLFPKNVRTIKFNNSEKKPQFIPNALEKLSQPKIQEEFDNNDFGNSADDFIFTF